MALNIDMQQVMFANISAALACLLCRVGASNENTAAQNL